jgi:MYXO-CTERM domain-containing protein
MRVLTRAGRVTVVLVAVAAAACPLAPAAATKTICVGLVVDARPLGGPLASDCTTVPDGSTGYDVLRKAGHTVGFRQDGLICSIDNRPADGCGEVDAAHYWAYFHREPGASSWTYSNEGATTYEPENNETEGWVWRDADMAKPPNIPYRTICPQTSSASPSASAHRSKPSPSASSHSDAASVSPRTTTPVATPNAARTHHRQRPSATTSSPPATSLTPTPSESARIVSSTTTGDESGSSGPPYALLAGAVAVLALGGIAAFRGRRRGVE